MKDIENDMPDENTNDESMAGTSESADQVVLENGIDPGFLRDDLCYDHTNGRFWMKMNDGHWTMLSSADARQHLRRRIGIPEGVPVKDVKFLIEEILVTTQSLRSADYVGAIGGYADGYYDMSGLRVLVKSGPKFIEPKPGNWSMLQNILQAMFGDVQLNYVYAWIKISLEMFWSGRWMPGQAIALCGPPRSGKTLFGEILCKLFGGREPGKPYAYMTGDTQFTSDWIGKELLVIDDEVSKTTIQAREAFGARIKEMTVMKSMRLHKKGVEAATVSPLQRLVIMLNQNEERLRVLPPMYSDVADKIMLFNITHSAMPMPTATPDEQKAFWNALVAELPAFVDFLTDWEIPDDIKAERFGVAAYHHPDILAGLFRLTPEVKVLQLIDEVLFAHGGGPASWSGKANELERKLKTCGVHWLQKEAHDTISNSVQCGKYLGRLTDSCPERVTGHPGHGGVIHWTIRAPSPEASNDDNSEVPNDQMTAQDHKTRMAKILLARMNDPARSSPGFPASSA